MTKKQPGYDELLRENLLLKLELAKLNDSANLANELSLKNSQLQEMNEELNQIFENLKEKNKQLENLEKLYNLLSTNISDVIWMMDLNGRFTYASQSVKNLLGYSHTDIENYTIKDILTEESYIRHKQALSERLEKENRGIITSSASFIIQNVRKDGELIWVEAVVNPLRDENNKIYGLLGVTRDISERKEAEDRLNKLSVAVEQSPASIIITGIDGSIEYANQIFTKTTGYSFEEIKGKDPKILKSGLTPKQTYKDLWNSIMAGKVWSGEFINRKKNGEIYYENATIAPITDNDGSICNFVAIKENITKSKFNEQNLIKSEERYKLLSEISHEGIIIFENGQITDVNQSFTSITGFSMQEIAGKEHLDFLFEEELLPVLWDKIKSDYSYPFEIDGIKKSGKQFPAEIEIRQLKYKGRDLKILAIRDISYTKRVNQVLRSSLKLAEMLVNNTEQQIIDWGLEEAVRLSDSHIGFFHYVDEDQKTITLHTWSKETLTQCKIPDQLNHYPISEAGTWVDSFHERKPVVHNDYKTLNHKKGLPPGHFPLIRYISLPVIEAEKVKIIFGVGNKASDYDQFDVDVLSLFAKTIWMVIQRKRMEEKLTEANETKSKFLSLISHDLRSPVGSISSLTEMIVENKEILPFEEIFEFIKVIHQTSKTTYDQLENMLEWSRAQSSKLDFKPEKIDLKQFIIDFVKSNDYLTRKKEIGLNLNVNKELFVVADKNMMNSVMRNLFSNAIKFTPQNGNVNISLSENQQSEIVLEISDSGVGISPERLSNLFNIGKSTSTYGTANEKGSGLGLLLCKEFVERNNGKIQVESKLNEGSSFRLTFPKSE